MELDDAEGLIIKTASTVTGCFNIHQFELQLLRLHSGVDLLAGTTGTFHDQRSSQADNGSRHACLPVVRAQKHHHRW